MRKFKLGPITKLDKDKDKNAEHLKLPPTFGMNGNANFEETDENVLKIWGKLSEMDINAISQNCDAAYNSGWVELNFTTGDISELKSRWCIDNQEQYIYYRKMMEGEDTADDEERANQQFYEGFKEIWESGVEMSKEMHAAVKFGMNKHKPPNV